MTGEMRAWVFDGHRTLRLERHPIPEPTPQQVLLRVARAGICGSDIHGYAGVSGMRQPGIVMGHEASGIVEVLGAAVHGLQQGERVTFAPTLPCDGSCGHDAENHCEQLKLIGVTPGHDGAFADYVVLPAARVFPLGAVSLERGSQVEPLAVGLHAARRAGVVPGATVGVVGGGMIGQAVGLAAQLEGAANVTISDPLAHRRGVAAAFGFQAVSPQEFQEIGPFDCVVDAAGTPATLTTAVGTVRRGGTVALVGLGQPRAQFTLYDLVGEERCIVGSSCYTDGEFREIIAALADERLDLTPLDPVVIEFEQVGEALEALASGKEPALKVTMTTGAV